MRWYGKDVTRNNDKDPMEGMNDDDDIVIEEDDEEGREEGQQHAMTDNYDMDLST